MEIKGEIQSRTNLNGGELERIKSRNGKEFEVRVKKDSLNNQSKKFLQVWLRNKMHRFEPSVFRTLTTIVEFHYWTLNQNSLSQRVTEDLKEKERIKQSNPGLTASWSIF